MLQNLDDIFKISEIALQRGLKGFLPGPGTLVHLSQVKTLNASTCQERIYVRIASVTHAKNNSLHGFAPGVNETNRAFTTVANALHDSDTLLAMQSTGTLTGASGFGQDTTQSNQSNGTYTDTSTETFSATNASQNSFSLYERSSYGSLGYNFGSFGYRQSSSGSYSLSDLKSETQTGIGIGTTSSQGTTTDGTNTGTDGRSDAAAFSYVLTGISTMTAAGSSSSSDYMAGQYANGSYSFGRFTHDEQSTDSLSFSSAATLAGSSAGTRVLNTLGISTSGVNGTFGYIQDINYSLGQSGSSQGCMTLHARSGASAYGRTMRALLS